MYFTLKAERFPSSFSVPPTIAQLFLSQFLSSFCLPPLLLFPHLPSPLLTPFLSSVPHPLDPPLPYLPTNAPPPPHPLFSLVTPPYILYSMLHPESFLFPSPFIVPFYPSVSLPRSLVSFSLPSLLPSPISLPPLSLI
jgi:hypothetical protein